MKAADEYIKKITPLFLQFGIKSISMDDIARELGISKKTLYKVFKDKTDIVEKSIDNIKTGMLDIVNEFIESDLNVIEKEILQRKKYINSYLKIKPTYVFDLKKFYPQIFSNFLDFKSKIISDTTEIFINEGQQQGLFREDLDIEFMSKLSTTLTFAVFHPEIDTFTEGEMISKKYTNQFFIYHMNGICSEKGRKLFNELLRDELL